MTGLSRELGLVGLWATGVCAMLGAGVNVVPFMIQRNVPGIGPHVLFAFALGTIPALLAAFCYASLSSAMPRAGGSYLFASRGLNPYLGFVASFSQWFGISMAIGVVSYMVIPFLRDIAAASGSESVADFLELGPVRLLLPVVFLWVFTVVNLLGAKIYERTLIPLLILMFMGGLVAIGAGFHFDHADFAVGLFAREGVSLGPSPEAPFEWRTVLAASVLLFSAYIGFDAIAQAGGEARNPGRNLPLAICLCILAVGGYYIAFTAAVYHAVPWGFVAERAQHMDLTAPGLLGYVIPPGWTVLIVGAAAVALINDLPAMILSVSRLMFAWAEDGIFPVALARIHERYHTPYRTILASSITATLGIMLVHSAGDFFLGVDLQLIAMLVNFLLVSLAVVLLRRRNPALSDRITFLTSRPMQLLVGGAASALLVGLILIQVYKDLSVSAQYWYFHSTYTYLVVLGFASLIFIYRWRRMDREGVDLRTRFSELPPN